MPDALAEIFLQQNPACHWIVSPEGVFDRFYGDPAPLFGRPALELTGRAPAAVLEPVHATAWRERFARALAGDTLLLRERRGKETWYISVFPIRMEGRI